MSAKLMDLTHASADAIMAAVDLGNLAFWEARREREYAEERLAHAAAVQNAFHPHPWWTRDGDLRPVARALTLTAWFNRADD